MLVFSKTTLKEKSTDCSSLEEGLEIIAALKSALFLEKRGIGLAAPQIGIKKRVFISRLEGNITGYVNPVFLQQEELHLFDEEGCLSFPGTWMKTIRFKKAVVSDLVHGESHFSDLAAVVAQHEADHLDGILMFDRQANKFDPCFCGSGKKLKFCHA